MLLVLLIPLLCTGTLTEDLIEKYAQALNVEKPSKRKLKALREQILEVDPENKEQSQLQLALHKFRYLIDKEAPVEEALKPLQKYLKKYGKIDPEGAKAVELLIVKYQENCR
jgi:hypothetical protein